MDTARCAVGNHVVAGNMTRTYRAECPVPVKRAVMVQKWENLVYLHWAYEPEQVQ